MGKARSTGKVKVVLLRAMGAIIFAVVLIIIAIAGLRWHNASMYTVMGNIAAMGAEASYETNDGIRAIEGDYLKGFHFIPERRTHPGTVVVYGGSEGSPAYDQAEAICAQGYEVIALYFWGQEGQASTLANVPLEQFNEVEAYIEGSIDHPRPITVVGSSKGAEFSAELVTHGFAIENDERFALDLLKEKRILIVHGGGFNWHEPDHFRIVYLPRIEIDGSTMATSSNSSIA